MDTEIITEINGYRNQYRYLYMDTEIKTEICTWIKKLKQRFVHGYRN